MLLREGCQEVDCKLLDGSSSLHRRAIWFHEKSVLVYRSCSILTFHSWAKARNDSHKVDVILLGFTKAFDSVPHQRLLAKLKGYGIGGNLLNWLTHFIVGRKQRVSFRGHFSPWTMVTSGVPQGSVLGPVLFLAYINDITTSVRSSMRLFADDSKVYRIIYDENDGKQLQFDLNTLQKWSEIGNFVFTLTNVRFYVLPMREIILAIFTSSPVVRFSLSPKRLIWGCH